MQKEETSNGTSARWSLFCNSLCLYRCKSIDYYHIKKS